MNTTYQRTIQNLAQSTTYHENVQKYSYMVIIYLSSKNPTTLMIMRAMDNNRSEQDNFWHLQQLVFTTTKLVKKHVKHSTFNQEQPFLPLSCKFFIPRIFKNINFITATALISIYVSILSFWIEEVNIK